MKRAWITATNLVLGGATALLVAWTVSQVWDAVMTQIEVAGPSSEGGEPVAVKSWTDVAQIIDRNVFNASTLAPTPVAANESYEKSGLPLRLLATLAAGDDSWAAFEDSSSRKTLVAGVNRALCRDCQFRDVIVHRIERCRVVLQNQGRREELVLESLSACTGGVATARPRSPAVPLATARARGVQPPIRRLAENRFAVPAAEVENMAANPAALFSQARILPKYEDGRMVGVQLNAIRQGSLFAQVGIRDGDTVTEVNGVTVATPEDSQRLLQEFASGGALRVTVKARDGQIRELEYLAQ
jgi:general secretion pathway protein C